jgi:hypothetical protein
MKTLRSTLKGIEPENGHFGGDVAEALQQSHGYADCVYFCLKRISEKNKGLSCKKYKVKVKSKSDWKNHLDICSCCILVHCVIFAIG